MSKFDNWAERPRKELPRFELMCDRCGTGIIVEKREDLEEQCPWCGNPHMAVYEKINL